MDETSTFRLCGSWLFEPTATLATLWRPSDGSRIELEGLNPSQLGVFFAEARSARRGTELAALLQPFGEDAGPLLDLLREEQVLVEPSDPVASARHVELIELLGSHPTTNEAASFTTHRDGLVLWQGGCAQCLALRALGVLDTPGEQTEPLGTTLEPSCVDALLAAASLHVASAPLAPGEAVLVRFEAGVERGHVLPHPDCRHCRATRAARDSLSTLQLELDSGELEPPPAEAAVIAARFGSSPFAPLSMAQVDGAPGRFPFDLPFLAGDTRLTRRIGEKLFCTSIEAIAHGSAPSVDRSQMLAWSEGVERIAAQSVTANATVSSTDERVYPAYRLTSSTMPCCEAWDLLDERAWLVPHSLVAVATPNDRGDIVEPTFTGAASHTTYLHGILHATVEVLKREAFLVAWYRKRSLTRLDWPARLPSTAASRASYLKAHGIELAAFDLSTDVGLPMVLLRLRATRRVGNWPAGGVQLFPAGGFTPLEALSHALGLACTRFAGLGLDASPEKDPLNERAIADLSLGIPAWRAMVRYLDPRHSPELEFLFSDRHLALEELGSEYEHTPRERLAQLRESLRRQGLGWLGVALTTPDMRACGLRVVKVLVPEALRFVLTSTDVPRAHRRLNQDWTFAAAGSWNELPHPLY